MGAPLPVGEAWRGLASGLACGGRRGLVMAAGASFDVLFKRARRAPHSRNTAFIKVGSEEGF